MRSKLIAREIKRTKPDLIGMQEVAIWRRGPVGVKDGATTPSTEVVYDFLAVLRRDLKRLGLKYAVGSKQQETDIEAPIDAGHDVRLTMFDVTLVKKSKQLKVRSRFGRNYPDSITVPTPAGPLTSTRGWTGVDVTFKGKRLRSSTRTSRRSSTPRARRRRASSSGRTGRSARSVSSS